MSKENKYHFLKTLQHLREQESLMLFSKLYSISADEEQAALQYLSEAYQQEALEYPHEAPVFDGTAALWAAKTFYHSSQLLLNREKPEEELTNFIPLYGQEINASNMLSADLYLRFLPLILQKAQDIDPEDKLIELIEQILGKWHYSSIGYLLKEEPLNFEAIVNNPCLYQLYVNRVIEKKAEDLAQRPALQKMVKASLGNYKELLWKELSFKKDE